MHVASGGGAVRRLRESPAEMLASVVDDVGRFMGAAPAATDIIMLALRMAALH